MSPTTSTLDPAAATLLAKLCHIPDGHRRFSVSAEQATAEYQIPVGLLDDMRTGGMSARRLDGTWWYDSIDLLNIAMQLDIGSRRRTVLSWWLREVRRPHGATVTYQLDFWPSCPAPGHPGPCRYSFVGVEGRRVETTGMADHEHPAHSLTFEIPQQWPAIPPAVRGLLDEMTEITFLRLPVSLRWNTSFVHATGLGDCPAVAKILVERAVERGMQARFIGGRTLTPPFSAVHYWAEILIEDHWVPVDPVLITALQQWGLCDPAEWTRYDTFGGIMARFSDRPEPLALHDGTEVPCRLAAYRLAAATKSRDVTT